MNGGGKNGAITQVNGIYSSHGGNLSQLFSIDIAKLLSVKNVIEKV